MFTQKPHSLFLISELYCEEAYGNSVSGGQIQSSVMEPAVKLSNVQSIPLAAATFHAQLKAVGIELSEVCNLFIHVRCWLMFTRLMVQLW